MIPAKQRRRRSRGTDEPDSSRRGGSPHRERGIHDWHAQVAPGDYIVRMDQPYNAIVETLLGVQFYAPENPRPYDDTGWAIPLVRNLKTARVEDKSILDKPMTLAAADFKIAGTIAGTGRSDRRSHDRQHARDVPISARQREDVGRREGIRCRRAPFRPLAHS